jgi:hypothetical protein
MKLTTNKPLQACYATTQASRLLVQLANAEQLAPVNVHSHGQMLQQAIDELESALELARQFQLKMQGR